MSESFFPTAWRRERAFLLVHALHCPDDASAAALVADIQARYEAPLKEIFE